LDSSLESLSSEMRTFSKGLISGNNENNQL
jgi:hypothetical protein